MTFLPWPPLALLFFVSLGASAPTTIDGVLYDSGQVHHLAGVPEQEAGRIVRAILDEGAHVMRTVVSEDDIARIRLSESALELYVQNSDGFRRLLGSTDVASILIPLSGEFGPAGEDSHVTLFIGFGFGFYGAPVRIAGGYEHLERLVTLAEKYKVQPEG